jgi:hypothetical protein
LKKFGKDWKTLDQNKIDYLMKYGIVQEVMKVEERKSIRALRPPKTASPARKRRPTVLESKDVV